MLCARSAYERERVRWDPPASAAWRMTDDRNVRHLWMVPGLEQATAQAVTALGLGNYPSDIPGALAKLTRLRRRQPRWFTTADDRLWDLGARGRHAPGR
jgi:hypothetical protein